MERELHPLAAAFGEVADAYDRGRPDYPSELADLLTGRLGIGTGARVLDVGAGTGKLTQTLLLTGAEVLAAEPAPDLRRVLGAVLAPDRILDGTAEALPLDSASVDAVAVGDAFHWFDGARAPDELARVLRPGGHLVLVSHVPLVGEPGTWRAELRALLDSVRGEHPFFAEDQGRGVLEGHPSFGALESVRLAHRHAVDRDGMADHMLSISYVAAMAPEEQERVLAEVRRILQSAPERIEMDYPIDVWISRRR